MRYAHTAIRTRNREVHVGGTYVYIEGALVVEARLIEDSSNDEFLTFTFRPIRSNRPSLCEDFTVSIARSAPDYGGLWQLYDPGAN